MSSDWEEIKRLAADFQRAQLSTSLPRLSERNCIEIINKLVELKLLEIYYTSTGKEYITPNHLIKEISDELLVNNGRINLIDVSNTLEVGLNIIEKKAADLARQDSHIYLVLGQLLSENYLNTIAEEVNEKLQHNGSITIGDISKSYDLPGEFLVQVINKRLGKIIKGKQDEKDPHIIFTEAFVGRYKCQIRGVFSAITQPTSISSIISRYKFQEHLFFSLLEKFIATGEIRGSISDAKASSQAVYIPSIYSKAQYNWVESFLKQNGYVEYDSLKGLGISDGEAYINRHFKDLNLTFVPGVCFNHYIIDQIDANLDEALANGGYVDVLPFLPATFPGDVYNELIKIAITSRQNNAHVAKRTTSMDNCHIFCDSIAVSELLLNKVFISLEKLMPLKAKEAVSKGAFRHQLSTGKGRKEDESGKNKKEDRRKKAAGGKAGGGTQGRETKTKSTKIKSKGRKGAHQNSDDDEDASESSSKPEQVMFLSLDDLQDEIGKLPDLEDCPEELVEALAKFFEEPATRKFQDVAKEIYLASMSGGGSSRKNSHSQLQEKVVTLLTTVRLAEKALKEFGDDLQSQLCKYLLRTYCSEIVNEIVLYLASESQIDFKYEKELSPELRLKIINQFEENLKQPNLGIHKSLAGQSIDLFLDKVDDAMAAADIIAKKKDNKKDRQFMLNHRSGLVDQLTASHNSALSLHLSCLILFQAVTGKLLHASGKFVPQILAYLKPNLPSDLYELLHEYQGLVMKSLTMKENDSSSSINSRLEELTPKLKDLSILFKKSNDRNSISED